MNLESNAQVEHETVYATLDTKLGVCCSGIWKSFEKGVLDPEITSPIDSATAIP
jgi:hypothetical protein